MTSQVNEVTFDTRDEYQRKPIAEKVIQLLTSGADVSPMVIDGGWGTGKTEFCNKLIHLIENGDSGYKAVYVDAFKADHADEPMMTLLAAVLKLLPEEDRPSFIQKALPAVRFGVKATLKAGVRWLLRQDAADLAEGLEQDLKNAGDEAINHAVESLLSDHVAAEESIGTLKEALAEIAKESPIVVFVDELDRCRPDFSVAMLESIKHVFDVDGVQFVLVTNSNQLRASINHCYGSAIDAQRYLDKFLKFSFTLSDTFKSDGHNEMFTSIQHLRMAINSSKILNGIKIQVVDDFMVQLVTHNRLSLREIETFVRYLEIYHTLTEEKGLREDIIPSYRLLRVFGVFLFSFKLECVDMLSRGFVDAPKIAASLGKSELMDLSGGGHPDYADIVTAIVSLEATIEANNLTPYTIYIGQQWEEIIRNFFRGGTFPPDAGERVRIISSAIDVLRLGG